MNRHRVFLGLSFVGLLVLAAACGGSNGIDSSPSEQVATYDQLLTSLRANGYTVEEVSSISQPFFEPEGQVIIVKGQEIQVFEFSSVEKASTAAESIAPDGGSIGTSMVSWISTPHFYYSGKIIVLYVGDDESVISALEEVLGKQIAGR